MPKIIYLCLVYIFTKCLTSINQLIQQSSTSSSKKPCLNAIDAPITFSEVKAAINKLIKGKSLGLNHIPPEALKAMNDTPRQIVHKHVSDFFEGKADHEGWHKSQCIPVPKMGDLSGPNKWQGIMLMKTAKSSAWSSTLELFSYSRNMAPNFNLAEHPIWGVETDYSL
jgi:hypothetical protein